MLTTIGLGPVRTVDVVDAPLHREGIPQTTAKEVTLKITAVEGKMRDSWQQSFRAVRVGGRWAWILPDADVDDYRAGRCPPSSSPGAALNWAARRRSSAGRALHS